MKNFTKVFIKRSDGSYILLNRSEMDAPWRFKRIGYREGYPVYALKELRIAPHLKVVK